MDGQDSVPSSMNSTDTSQLLRELKALNLDRSPGSSVGSYSGNVIGTSDRDGRISGEATHAQTLTQFMRTMYTSAPRQQIVLQGNDNQNSFSVYGRDVDVYLGGATSGDAQMTAGSNKVKITPVVNFDWEAKYYIGNLVAVHRDNNFVAYVLKGKSSGVVRVISRKTAERVLLKDFVGRVIDIAFAHTDEILLAVVDEIGNLSVYGIQEAEGGKIISSLVLQVKRPEDTHPSEFHRVIWCPYIPEDCDETMTDISTQDSSRVLVLTHNEQAEIWGVDMVTKEYGFGPLYAKDIDTGLIVIDSHSQPIVDAAFSPDGTALATASLDGEVKFFQVYMQEGTSPRCLHQWKPHEGKPMSCLFFLDDHKNLSGDAQFWKYAVTGANRNQELKVWSCESWNCLQTIRFLNAPSNPSELCLKAGLDLGAKYLILSDKTRKVLYVLQIHQEGSATTAHVSSISEFLLAQPCLSFAILDASSKRLKKSANDSHLDEITTGELDRDDPDDENQIHISEETTTGVQLRLYAIHTKALQELLIRYKPESSVPPPSTPSVSSISHDETGLRDTLSDISMSVEGSTGEGDHGGSDSSALPHDNSNPVLLTPDAFITHSPSKVSVQNSVTDAVRVSGSSTSSFTHVTAMNEELYSPRSSASGQHSMFSPGERSILSPGTSLAQTPTSTKNDSSRSQEVTPSNVPLPPIDSVEEEELATPKTGRNYEDENNIQQNRSALEVLEDFFTTRPTGTQHLSLDSTSSTGRFDVSDLTNVQQQQRKISNRSEYDENDMEVADVLGERNSLGEEDGGAAEEFQDQGELTEDEPHRTRAWPKPPDVPVGSQTDVTVNSSLQGEDSPDEEEEVVVEGEEDDAGEGDDDADTEEIEEVIEEEESEEERQDGNTVPDRDTGLILPPSDIMDDVSRPMRRRSTEMREPPVHIVKEVVDREALRELQLSLETMTATLHAQQDQIAQLQQQILEQHNRQMQHQQQQLEQWRLQQVSAPQPGLQEQLQKMEDVMASQIERVLSQHLQKQSQNLQEVLSRTEARHRHEQERLQTTVTQSVGSAVTLNLEKAVRGEMKNTVVPCISKVIEPIREQLHQDLAQKLTATDALLKDSIAKMVRSRQTMEALATATGNVIQAPIQAAYREAFQNLVLPSFERASQTMFQQVNEAFQRGTSEYTNQLEGHLDKIRQRNMEARDPVLKQLNSLVENFQTSSEQMKTEILSALQTELSTQLQNALTNLQDRTLNHVREVVKEEVSVAVREHGASLSDRLINYVRSGAATPVQISPELNQIQSSKSAIVNQLRIGNINDAFQTALSAANLDLVVFTCETVNPSQVFSVSPCPLAQPVLLSLISQLSADLGSHTELKIKYLEEAVMNLDASNPVTVEHMCGVLSSLCQKLKVFIVQHPNDKIIRTVKMLAMAAQSLLT